MRKQPGQDFLVRLSYPEHDALKAKAKEEERSMAMTLRRALRVYCGMEEEVSPKCGVETNRFDKSPGR